MFFRGGYGELLSDRAGELITDGHGAAGKNEGTGVYYIGGGTDLMVTRDLWGMAKGIALVGEIGLEFKRWASTNVANGDTTGVTGVSNGGLSKVQLTMLTASVAPKVKFRQGTDFQPWIIPAGLDFHVISPTSSQINYLDIGVQFGGGAEFRLWKELWLGFDSRFHLASKSDQYREQFLDGWHLWGHWFLRALYSQDGLMDKQAVLQMLGGGDRRSIGRANRVVEIIRREPALFPALIDGMHHDDELVRMRAADEVEKLTVTNPEWLQPFRVQLIKLAARATQQELRCHLAQMLPRLELSRRDRVIVVAVFRRYLKDRSRIVKTFAMQGLTDLATQDPRLKVPTRRLISSLIKAGSPSMKSRGRKLLLRLNASTVPRHAPVFR